MSLWCRRSDHARPATGHNVPEGFRVLHPSKYEEYSPAQIYTKLYLHPGEITSSKAGDTIKLHSAQLKRTKSILYVFKQYQYMKARIDRLRTAPRPGSGKDGVIVTGTPGIGRIRSTLLYSSNGFSRQIHIP